MKNVPLDRVTPDDLYLVVHQHCEQDGTLGFIAQVEAVEPAHPCMFLRCHCGAEFAHDQAHALIAGEQRYHPLSWLKRIPPMGELEGEKRDEEITA